MRFDEFLLPGGTLSVACVRGSFCNLRSINELSLLLLHYTPSVHSILHDTSHLCLCSGVISAWTQFGACTISCASNSAVPLFSCPPNSNKEHSPSCEFCLLFLYTAGGVRGIGRSNGRTC